MKVDPGPLTAEHLKYLNGVIDSCNATAKMCEKCERCMLDVKEEKDKNAEQLQVALALKKEFFPTAK